MNDSLIAKLKELADQGTVIDVDLSEWDRRIRFVVAKPNDALSELSDASDIFNVDFIRTSAFNLDLTRRLNVDTEDERHTRWTLWGATIRERSTNVEIQLRGSGPEVNLECEDIDITVLDSKGLTALSPGWFHPGQPLARGSVETLIGKLLGKRSDHSSRSRK
jgi:hypothetical protein